MITDEIREGAAELRIVIENIIQNYVNYSQ